jgi:hypothetical protein
MSGTAFCSLISGTADSARADVHHAIDAIATINSVTPRLLHQLEAHRVPMFEAFSAMEALLSE